MDLLKMARKAQILCFMLSAILALAAGQPRLARGAEAQEEYTVKAAFLLNFGRLVEWPAIATPASREPLVICVFGNRFAYEGIERGARDFTVNNHPVVTREVENTPELAACHILFVSGDSGKLADTMLHSAHAAHVLTVGESPGFAEAGGVINFFKHDKKTRFEINRKAAEAASLRISSRLLRLARIVDE